MVCGHALNLIVHRGARQVRDNITVKKHLQNFVASQSAFVSDDMLAQAGATVSNPICAPQKQNQPTATTRDPHSYRRMKSTTKN